MYLYSKVIAQEKVDEVKKFAKSRGFKVIFRNISTNTGDFHFFIYRPGFNGYHTKYLIAYDGYWDVPEYDAESFDICIEKVKEYIKE